MPKFTLTLLDTTGIQNYTLRQEPPAGEYWRLRAGISRATSLWALKALEEAVGSHNVQPRQKFQLDFTNACIEDDASLQAEVIQAAGGNTVILFRDEKKSREFVRILTRRLL